jgi:hypothetical protein
MRKSAAVKLTLVPLLAMSALAYAQAPGQTPAQPDPTGTDQARFIPFDAFDGAPDAATPVLSPPGMTPTIDELRCEQDPNAELRDDCTETEIEGERVWVDSGVVRGGYGGYFWTGGG